MESKLSSKKEDCWYKNVCSQDCTFSCIRYLEMSYLMDNSGIPKSKQRPIDLYPSDEDYNAFVRLADIKQHIEEFVKSGRNLYITSAKTGNGKTSWAIKLMLKYFDRVWAGNGFNVRGYFVHVPSLLLNLKDFNNPNTDISRIKKNVLTADLVVWDDIASTVVSNYDYSQLLMLIDTRCLEDKSNIYTGNLNTKAALNKMLNDKLASRIWELSEVIEFKGKDRRNEC